MNLPPSELLITPMGDDDGRWHPYAHPERNPCSCWHRGQFTHTRQGTPVRRFLLSYHAELGWQLTDRLQGKRIGGMWKSDLETAKYFADGIIALIYVDEEPS
jgi:hypothetical protein